MVSAWICCQTLRQERSTNAPELYHPAPPLRLWFPSSRESSRSRAAPPTGAVLSSASPCPTTTAVSSIGAISPWPSQASWRGGRDCTHIHIQQWQTEQECGIICCSLSHCVFHTAPAYPSASTKSKCSDDSVIRFSMNSLPGSGRDKVLATESLQDLPPQCRQAMTVSHCRLYVQGCRCDEACRCLGWLSCFRPRRQHPSLHRLRHRRRQHPAGRPVPASIM